MQQTLRHGVTCGHADRPAQDISHEFTVCTSKRSKHLVMRFDAQAAQRSARRRRRGFDHIGDQLRGPLPEAVQRARVVVPAVSFGVTGCRHARVRGRPICRRQK